MNAEQPQIPILTIGAVLEDKAKRAAKLARDAKDPGPRRGKNPCAKTRDKDHPYEIWRSPDGSWEWRILKKWQLDDDKPFARWFCYVISPHADEYGDVYVRDIKSQARKVGA